METKRLVTDGRARLHDQLQGGADGDLHHQDQQEEEQEPVHRSIRRIASTDHQWTSWSKKKSKRLQQDYEFFNGNPVFPYIRAFISFWKSPDNATMRNEFVTVWKKWSNRQTSGITFRRLRIYSASVSS